MSRRSVARSLFVLVAALVALPAAAQAELKTYTYRVGPINVSGYQVKQGMFGLNPSQPVPKPDEDGFVVGLESDIVDASGNPVPIQRLMLHHLVFSNLGRFIGDRHDGTCNQFTALDSKTKLPGVAERFGGTGEERNKVALPDGYGYPVKGGDRWLLSWMLMNHQANEDSAYIQYKVTYDNSTNLTPVKPYWLDVRNCLSDPIFDVPGGGKPGSTFSKSTTWTVPESGRLIAGGGHVHGGAKNIVLTQPNCKDRNIEAVNPTWGNPDHPFYHVKPILHEPGPISMGGFATKSGIPFAKGEKIKLTANYDGALPHTRVMGISVIYMAPDSSVTSSCNRIPNDVVFNKPPVAGRSVAPKFTVPIIGIGSNGIARSIARPPGATVPLRSGATIDVGDLFFSRPNVKVTAGSTLKWRFGSNTLHDITLANGPRGFSSPHLNGGRTFAEKFTVPGTYKIFCGLHPVDMTATVKVVPKKVSKQKS